jgi:hypothetical protein
MIRWVSKILVVASLTHAINATPAQAQDTEIDFLLGFVVGDYVLIGRESNNGSPYNGVARIERTSDGLIIRRRIGDESILGTGTVKASISGESILLQFHDAGAEPRQTTCLIQSDLDNYARLTCLWTGEGAPVVEPGLEAYFPTETWPDTAPNKGFNPE